MDITPENMCETMNLYLDSVLENNPIENCQLFQSNILSDQFKFDYTDQNITHNIVKDDFITFLISEVVGKFLRSKEDKNLHSPLSSNSLESTVYFIRHFQEDHPLVNLAGWYRCNTNIITTFEVQNELMKITKIEILKASVIKFMHP